MIFLSLHSSGSTKPVVPLGDVLGALDNITAFTEAVSMTYSHFYVQNSEVELSSLLEVVADTCTRLSTNWFDS